MPPGERSPGTASAPRPVYHTLPDREAGEKDRFWGHHRRHIRCKTPEGTAEWALREGRRATGCPGTPKGAGCFEPRGSPARGLLPCFSGPHRPIAPQPRILEPGPFPSPCVGPPDPQQGGAGPGSSSWGPQGARTGMEHGVGQGSEDSAKKQRSGLGPDRSPTSPRPPRHTALRAGPPAAGSRQ